MAAPHSLHEDPAEGQHSAPLGLHIPAWEPCCGERCGVRNRSYVRVGRISGLDCDKPVQLVRGCGAVRVTVCDNRRDDKCAPCSAKHRRYLVRRAEIGCELPGHIYLLTLTAPGTVQHDRLDPKLDGSFANSRHRLALPAWRRPDEARPPCRCALPAAGLEQWNPAAGASWNRFRTAISRDHQIEFLRVVEVQKRGALHLHVLVRSELPLDVLELQGHAIAAGFGCSLDLSRMPAARAARYVAKYAAKGYTERAAVPWRDEVLDKDTGEMRTRQMASYRTVSQSHGWGLTLRQIKEAIRASRVAARLAASEAFSSGGSAGDPSARPVGSLATCGRAESTGTSGDVGAG